jgi:hypothetical protein
MNSVRIGPVELVVLVVLAVGMGVAVTSGQSTLVVTVVAGTAFMIAAFLSTRLCLYFLVYSMLLGPELEFGGEFTGGAAGRHDGSDSPAGSGGVDRHHDHHFGTLWAARGRALASHRGGTY